MALSSPVYILHTKNSILIRNRARSPGVKERIDRAAVELRALFVAISSMVPLSCSNAKGEVAIRR